MITRAAASTVHLFHRLEKMHGQGSATAYDLGIAANADGTKPWSVRAFTTPRNSALCVKPSVYWRVADAAEHIGAPILQLGRFTGIGAGQHGVGQQANHPPVAVAEGVQPGKVVARQRHLHHVVFGRVSLVIFKQPEKVLSLQPLADLERDG